jgi:hypothetical protein
MPLKVCNSQIGVYGRVVDKTTGQVNSELYKRSDFITGNCESQYSFNLKDAPSDDSWIDAKVIKVKLAGGTEIIFEVDGAGGQRTTPGIMTGGNYTNDNCSDTFWWVASYSNVQDAIDDKNCVAKSNGDQTCEACEEEGGGNEVGPERPEWQTLLECHSRPPIGPTDPPQPIQKECMYQFRIKYSCGWLPGSGPEGLGSVYLATKLNPGDLLVTEAWWDSVLLDTWGLCDATQPGPPCNPDPAREGHDIYLTLYKKVIHSVPEDEVESFVCPDSLDPADYPDAPTMEQLQAIFAFAGMGCPRLYKLKNCVTNIQGQCGQGEGRHTSLGGRPGEAGMIISTPWNKPIPVPVLRGSPVAINGGIYYRSNNGSYVRTMTHANTCFTVEELAPAHRHAALAFAGQASPYHYANPETYWSYSAPTKFPDCNACGSDIVVAVQPCSADVVSVDGDCNKIKTKVLAGEMYFRRINWVDNPNHKAFFEANPSFVFSDIKACYRVDYIPNPTTYHLNWTFFQSGQPIRYGGRGAASVTYTNTPLFMAPATVDQIIAAQKHDDCCKCQDSNLARILAGGAPPPPEFNNGRTDWQIQIDPEICNPTKGACCNSLSAQCKDDLTRMECNQFRVGNREPDPPDTVFFPRKTCADLRAGPIGGRMRCQLPLGACCQGDGDCKENRSYENCYANHNGLSWHRNKSCRDALDQGLCPPDIGACCDMNQNRGKGRCRHLTFTQCKNLRGFKSVWWKGYNSTCSTCTPRVRGDARNMASGCCERIRLCNTGISDTTMIWVVTLEIFPDDGCSKGKFDASKQRHSTITMWTLAGGTYGFNRSDKNIGRWTCAKDPYDDFRIVPGRITNVEKKPYGSLSHPICSDKHKLTCNSDGRRKPPPDRAGSPDCTYPECGCWGVGSGWFCSCKHMKKSLVSFGTAGCAHGGGCGSGNYTEDDEGFNHQGVIIRHSLAYASCDCPKGEGYPEGYG